MYGKDVSLEETKFLYCVNKLIKVYKRGPLTDTTTSSIITKESIIERIKVLGKASWIDEELIQDQINKL